MATKEKSVFSKEELEKMIADRQRKIDMMGKRYSEDKETLEAQIVALKEMLERLEA